MIKRATSSSTARVTRVTKDQYRSQSLNVMRKPSSLIQVKHETVEMPIQLVEQRELCVPSTVSVQHVSRLNSTVPTRERTMDSGNVSLNMSSLSFISRDIRNHSCRSRRSFETTHVLTDRDLGSPVNYTKESKRQYKYRYRCCPKWCPCCSPCCCLVTGLLTALLLALLATLIAVLLFSKSTTTTTTTTTTSQTTTTSTTSTSTTSTTSTSTSTTTSTTSTSTTTTTTSTSTTSTTSTSTSTTTSSTTSTTATTSTSSTTTSSTSTSTTSTTTTSVTTTTRTTTTSVTTTTVTTTSTAATVSITSNTCTTGWNGVTVFTFCTNCPDIPSYQQYSYTYTAIATSTRIAFALREDVGYFALDDISVRSVTASSVELLTNGGFETGSYSPWIYCNPTGASASGTLKRTSNSFSYGGYTYAAHGGSYYYLDGAVGSADYISQIFSTTIGQTYNISFWMYNQGSGSNSDARIILSH